MASPPVVFHNATVLALDGAGGRDDAMAVADGNVPAVGDEPAIRAATGGRARNVDLSGRVVVPGFVDVPGPDPPVRGDRSAPSDAAARRVSGRTAPPRR